MRDLKQIVAAVVLSFLTVAGAALGATLAAVVTAVIVGNVWCVAGRREHE